MLKCLKFTARVAVTPVTGGCDGRPFRGRSAGASYSECEYTAGMKAAGFGEACRIDIPGPADLFWKGLNMRWDG